MSKKNLLPPKTGDLSDWYTTVIQLADMCDYGPVKGTVILKPYAFALWERVQEVMNVEIKKKGVGNAYFPLLIPMSLLEKEANHVEGFAPELAVVTHGGGQKLEENLAIRPTSETIMYNSYSKWVQSWRDLPILINQWNNVVRWEVRTMPFLRTSEFLWQEGHTAHATHEEATEMQLWAINMYAKIYRDYFAIDGYVGYKSQSEKFAGADQTLTFESLMPSGKALQSCTSHDLGQNFSKTFDISFQNKQGETDYAWQTSWGFSTRSLGGLILVHGDDNGLRIPPMMASIQTVVVPVKADDSELVEYCNEVAANLIAKGISSKVDDRDDESFGYRLNKWEVKGVPLIIKVGAKEIEAKQVTIKNRFNGNEQSVDFAQVEKIAGEMLSQTQSEMLAYSSNLTKENTREAKTYDEFKQIIAEHKGFVKVYWNDDPTIEATIKQETKATSRCRPIDQKDNPEGIDFYTGKPASQYWIFALSY